ncbi:excisionase family DNA-binding protein [Bremerella sp. T1]
MVSRPTVVGLIKSGELKAIMVGTQYRITEADLTAYCESAVCR